MQHRLGKKTGPSQLTALTPTPAADMFQVRLDIVRTETATAAEGSGLGQPARADVSVVVVFPGLELAAPALELGVAGAVHGVGVAVDVLLASKL